MENSNIKTNMEEMNDEMMEDVVGGSSADLEAFQALAKEKGWAGSDSLAGRMATAKMYQAVGMKTVRWNVASGARAEFIDYSGNVHPFDEVYEKMKALPNK